MSVKPWRLVKSTTEKVGWRNITHKTFELPDGTIADYDIYGPENTNNLWGGVIALTENNEVIVTSQFRPGPEKVFQGIPAGQLFAGEDAKTGAMRELLEETGYSSDEVSYLGRVYQSAYLDNVGEIFLAKNCRKITDAKLEENEDIEISFVPVKDFIANAKAGKTIDTGPVLLAYDYLIKLVKEENNG
jgi:ADP-ribose pyrophosphatase